MIDLGANIKVDVYECFEAAMDLQSTWDEFVERHDGDIYLTFDWCRTWWEFYGAGRSLRLYVFRGSESIVGLLPLFLETLRIGPLGLKVARVLGADHTTGMVNIVLNDEISSDVLQIAYSELVGRYGCDVVILGPSAENYSSFKHVLESVEGCSEVVLYKSDQAVPYSLFSLPDTYDGYLNSLPKRQRSNLKRDINLIERSLNLSRDTIRSESDAEAVFMDFVELHTAQWKAEKKLGHFYDWPLAIDYNLALAKRMANYDRLRLIRYRAGEKALCYQLCYAFGRRSFWRLPARPVGPDYDKFAFGRVGLAGVIETAIEEGLDEIEGGPGHYEYKVKMGAEEHNLRSVILVKNSAKSQRRAVLFMRLAALLHLLYYRLWFIKLAPRLPFKRRPLWKLWIRTRF